MAAVMRQSAHLKTYELGQQAALTQKLLNEVSAAKVCLMDPQRKAAYDARLRQELDPRPAPASPQPGSLPAAEPVAKDQALRISSAGVTPAAKPAVDPGLANMIAEFKQSDRPARPSKKRPPPPNRSASPLPNGSFKWLPSSPQNRFLAVAAAATLLLLVLFGLLFSMRTADGTLIVEVSDPEATLQVLDARGTLLVEQKAGAEKVEIRVVPGKGKLRVVKNDVELASKEFTLVSGGRETINTRPKFVARSTPPTPPPTTTPSPIPNPPSPTSPPAVVPLAETKVETKVETKAETTVENDRPASETNEAGKWIDLFDGKTTSGWHLSDPRATPCWTAEDGQLVCTWRPGGVNLVSEAVFRNFDLQLDFWLDHKANSGVYLKGLYEVQLYDHTSVPTRRDQQCGAIFGQIAPSKDAFRGPGTWNSLEVRLVGRKVSVTLNGERVIDDGIIMGPTDGSNSSITEEQAGPIVLQCHAPQATIKFRNIRVKELRGVPSSDSGVSPVADDTTPRTDVPSAGDGENVNPANKNVASGQRTGPSKGANKATAVTIAGMFQVGLREKKTNQKRTTCWDFRADNSLWEKNKRIATWRAEAAQVRIEFDESWGPLVIRRNGKGVYTGVSRNQNRQPWSFELQQIYIVAVWQHQAAGGKPGNVTFWSNGHLQTPDGKFTWERNGSKLKLHWPPWVDDCTISPDGQSYEGKNQRGVHITGKFISGPQPPNP